MMLTVLLTLALAAFPARATEPRLANAVEIFTTNDYPADALRDQKQGVVTALVNVDAGGAPTACKVVKSSRVPSLDEVTCRLIMARARFLPQRDAADQPIVGISQARIKWVLPPTNREPTTDAVVRAIFDLAADGSLSNCTATRLIAPMRLSLPD